jgi:MFS transporter, OFA family, oxalate/formate antiporter
VLNRWTVAVAAVLLQTGFGSLYAWSVFREPLSEHYGATITAVNVTFFVANLVFGLSTFGAGFLLRRVGPRVLGVGGGLLFALGVLLSGFAGESLPLLYVTYGVVAAIGGGVGLIAPVAVLPQWFPERPGLAYGLALLGFGVGTVVNVPVITFLLSATGDPFATFWVLGIFYAALLGGAGLLVTNPPADERLAGSAGRDAGGGFKDGAYDLRAALRTRQWYAVWFMFLLNTTVGLAIYSDAQAMARSVGGAGVAAAAAAVVVISVVDTVGRLVWPILSDRLGGANVFAIMFLAQAAAFLLMPLLGSGSLVAFCVLASVVTSCYGGGYATMTALSANYYGYRDAGAIYGSIITASAVAGFGAPLLLARSADASGSYDLALYIMGAVMLVGVVIPLRLRPPGKR